MEVLALIDQIRNAEAKKGAKPKDIFPWGKDWPPPKGAGNYSDLSRKAKTPRDGAQYLDGYDDGYPTTAPAMKASGKSGPANSAICPVSAKMPAPIITPVPMAIAPVRVMLFFL